MKSPLHRISCRSQVLDLTRRQIYTFKEPVRQLFRKVFPATFTGQKLALPKYLQNAFSGITILQFFFQESISWTLLEHKTLGLGFTSVFFYETTTYLKT